MLLFPHLYKQRVLESNICPLDDCITKRAFTGQWLLRGRQDCIHIWERHTEVTEPACCRNSAGSLEAEEAERVKCPGATKQAEPGGTRGARRPSGGTVLWESGKTQPQLCSSCFCQGSGESQLSSIIRAIKGRNYRIKIKKWSMMIEARPEGGSKGRWKGKETSSVDLSALSFARPQHGTTVRRVKVRKALGLLEGKGGCEEHH